MPPAPPRLRVVRQSAGSYPRLGEARTSRTLAALRWERGELPEGERELDRDKHGDGFAEAGARLEAHCLAALTAS